MENSAATSEELEEKLDQKVVDWLGMNDLDRLSNFLESIGARNMNDIKFISKHEFLMVKLKLSAKIIDYYKFINAAALLIDGCALHVDGGAKQCTPSTLPIIGKEEISIDVKMSKKRDATSAFTDTDSAEGRAQTSSPSEFSAEDDDNIAKDSFLPHLYPPFVAYKDKGNTYSSSSSPVPEDTNEFVLNSYAADNRDNTSQEDPPCEPCCNKIKSESIPVDVTTTTTTTTIATTDTVNSNATANTISNTTTNNNNTSITTSSSNNTTTTTTSNRNIKKIKDEEDFERERQAFLEQFPLNRCTHVFKTKREMEAALDGLTWDRIYHEYGWGFDAHTGGIADLIMIRDDCKDVKRKILKKYGVENVHYFNYINGGGKKTEHEKDVVDYFKRFCIFLNP